MLHPRLNSELRRVPKGKNELSCAVLTERSNLPRRRQTLKQRLGILGRDGRSLDRMRLAVEVNHWWLTGVEAQASGALLDNQGEQIGNVVSAAGHGRMHWRVNNPISLTRPTRVHAYNRSAMAGFAAIR